MQGNINVNDFFTGYTNGRKDRLDWPQLLKLKDHPPNLFEKSLPHHCAELISSLPFKEYTDPFKAALNLALKLPDNVQMGLTTYFAYGFSEELGRGDSVTKLHCDMSDVVCFNSVFPELCFLECLKNLLMLRGCVQRLCRKLHYKPTIMKFQVHVLIFWLLMSLKTLI